jgi:DNA-binding XRE family transcriptional regulator
MLGKFIQQQREKLKLTQECVASELSISRQTYQLIERGSRDLTVPEARVLAALYEMPLHQLLAEKNTAHEVIFEKEFSANAEELQIRVLHKDLEKFKQVLLYVLSKVGGKPNVGETVLHKLLYFIDFDYYEKYEENIIGATYIKNTHGPTSVELGAIIQKMKDAGELIAVKSKYFTHNQKKYMAVDQPNLDVFSAREIQHIDDVLVRLSDKNAKEMAIYSHGDIPWRSAEDGKKISYESVFYRDEKYSVRNYEDEI